MSRRELGIADPARKAQLLQEIIDTISRPASLEALSARVAHLITKATETDVCFVHVLDATGRYLTLSGATPPFDQNVGNIQLEVGGGVAGWVAATGKPVVIIENKEQDPRYRYIPALRGTEFTSMISVPMTDDHAGIAGVLNMHTKLRREFTNEDVSLLTTIGSLIAGAMHRERMYRQLAAREHAHERFAERIIAATESERQRLARDIHDGISQRLISLLYHLDAATQAIREDPEFAEAQLYRSRDLVDAALDETRVAISGLRPPVLDDLGLAGGLTSIGRSCEPVRVAFDLSEHRLPEHVEIALYRIAQEALQNVVKHSGASTAHVSFRCTDTTATLEVRDNGRGFDIETRPSTRDPLSSYGLTSMTERAELVGGQLSIASRPGTGTTVTASIPLHNHVSPLPPDSGLGGVPL
ncbi:MAG TPA: GAF domain-containing sensor histidine kinase [Pseudonocardiaceae bacterium]